MTSPYAAFLLCAALAWHPASADLYKWVDSAGDVTYSSRPPPPGVAAEKVPEPPRPSAEEVRQTEERTKRIEEQANELEAQRLEQEAEAARLRALQPPAPIVIEQPVYVPQQIYYPPLMKPPPRKRHPDKKPPRHRPPPDLRQHRSNGSSAVESFALRAANRALF